MANAANNASISKPMAQCRDARHSHWKGADALDERVDFDIGSHLVT